MISQNHVAGLLNHVVKMQEPDTLQSVHEKRYTTGLSHFFNNINNDLCHNTNKQSYHKYSNDSKIIISIINIVSVVNSVLVR